MKKTNLILLTLLIVGCNSNPEITFNAKDLNKVIQSDSNYFKYSIRNLNFNDSSLYFNEYDSMVNNLYFFQKLCDGLYFPIKSDNYNAYKLFKVVKWPKDDVNDLVRGYALQQTRRITLINKELINVPIKDINNNILDSNSIKNKLVFVKFWFINCTQCVLEMPELNMIVDKYKDRDDILFLSFAFDEPKKLKIFLDKTTFKYKVISVDKSYVLDTLGIQIFPTHLLVRNNQIKKILKGPSEISEILKSIKEQ